MATGDKLVNLEVLKETVQKEVVDLKRAITNADNSLIYGDNLRLMFAWENGVINASYEEVNNSNTSQARTKGYFTPQKNMTLTINRVNVNAVICVVYASDGTPVSRTAYLDSTTPFYIALEYGKKYRFCLTAESDIDLHHTEQNAVFKVKAMQNRPTYDEINAVDEKIANDINSLKTASIIIENNTAWDDSTTNPKKITVSGYKCCASVIKFSKNAEFVSDASDNLVFIYYDGNMEKGGVTGSYNSIPETAEYFVFYAVTGVTITTANYQYFAFPEDTVKKIIVGNNYYESVDHVINLPVASSITNGYMSIADKLKLDNIVNPGSVTVNGSGTTKNAGAYGFLPTNDGLTNATALQDCIDALGGGGTIIVDYPGTYALSRTIKVPSNTALVFGAGVFIERTNSSSIHGRHVFINTAPFDGDANENISIIGLKIIPNGTITGSEDIEQPIAGLRGLVVMYNISHLYIDGFEVVDDTFGQYAIQVSVFDNVEIRNIHVETLKDAIHFGTGSNFTVEHGRFLTADDAIGICAVDYPLSNAGTGDITNGLIKDVVLLKENATIYNVKRGLMLLSGSWENWASGNEYRVYGDFCLNNGILYQSLSLDGPSTDTLVSTQAPTHTSGVQAYSDGMRWLVKPMKTPALQAKISNVRFEDIVIEREVTNALVIFSEDSAWMRAVYPGSVVPYNTDITLQNVKVTGSGSPVFLVLTTKATNIRISDSDLSNISDAVRFINDEELDLTGLTVMSMVGNYYNYSGYLFNAKTSSNLPTIQVSICGSMKGTSFVYRNNNVTPTILTKDIS